MRSRLAGSIASAGATALMVTIAGCGGSSGTASPASTSSTSAKPPLAAAADECGTTAQPEDGGASLTFSSVGAQASSDPLASDSPSSEDAGDSIITVACVLVQLKAPSAVSDHIDQTRALDGMQEDTWSHYKARWTYHPDNGLNMTIMDTDALGG